MQTNLNFVQKILEWLDFRKKLLKNNSTKKEENKELFNKILKFNLELENLKILNIQNYYEDFEKLYFDETTSDFSIKLKEKTYKVHRCILSARSNYFESAFLQETVESENKMINLGHLEMKSDIFEIILKYFYFGFHGMKKTSFSFDSFSTLLHISNYLDVKCPTFK